LKRERTLHRRRWHVQIRDASFRAVLLASRRLADDVDAQGTIDHRAKVMLSDCGEE